MKEVSKNIDNTPVNMSVKNFLRFGFQQNNYSCQFCRMSKTPRVTQSGAFTLEIITKLDI